MNVIGLKYSSLDVEQIYTLWSINTKYRRASLTLTWSTELVDPTRSNYPCNSLDIKQVNTQWSINTKYRKASLTLNLA